MCNCHRLVKSEINGDYRLKTMGAKVYCQGCAIYLGSNGLNDGFNHFLKFLSLGFRLEKLLRSGSRDLK